MLKSLALLASSFFSGFLGFVDAETSCEHTDRAFHCVEYMDNYDGDTVKFNISKVHPLIGKNISIRVNGVDTPEIKTRNDCEKELAYQAKKVVREALSKASRIDLKNISRGKYFRIVADVFFDGNDLGPFLISKGLAYPYKGGKKRKVNWCHHISTLF